MQTPLPDWADRSAWTVLDTAFQGGAYLLATWQNWLNDPKHPRMLHYVAVVEEADLPDWFDLADNYYHDPQLERLASQLAEQCMGVKHGFHRILLQDGSVSFTLCIGALKNTLDELRLQADTVMVDVFNPAWDGWAVKSLTRLCKRGTRLGMPDFEDGLFGNLHQAGFKPVESPNGFEVEYDPDWEIKTSRQINHAYPHPAARCAIVGAGLSGASIAQALALRGWQVTVIDSHSQPAEGASGLPAGVVAPYVTADDSPRARMSRSGTRLMLHHAQRLLTQDEDWSGTGVQEHRFDNTTRLQPLWHTHAGWINPAKLIAAWLQKPGITFQGNTTVAELQCTDGVWHLMDAQHQTITTAEVVILANAMGCKTLVKDAAMQEAIQGLQAVHGVMSMSSRSDCASAMSDWPHFAVNGHGSFIPTLPSDAGVQWLAGATFSTQATHSITDKAFIKEQHQFNFSRLQTLLPSVANDVQAIFENDAVKSWAGTRCVTPDRMPWVGAISPTLWINIGMGSRGLSFAALCAELLVAQLCNEPLPLLLSLARGLDVQRQLLKTHSQLAPTL